MAERTTTGDTISIEDIRFDAAGLVPAIVQENGTGDVLMLAYMSKESLRRTIDTGETWFWSRSRGELWNKGATSNNRQTVRWIRVDCDGDALLVGVDQAGGGACHVEGEHSCFHNAVEGVSADDPSRCGVVAELGRLIHARNQSRPEGSYTTLLFEGGVDRIAKKVGEEAVEVVLAAKNYATKPDAELSKEVADLLYHLLVLAEAVGLPSAEVFAELADRRGRTGLRPS